jgi:hypothetical protein
VQEIVIESTQHLHLSTAAWNPSTKMLRYLPRDALMQFLQAL